MKPAPHQRPRVINRKGEVVGGSVPGRFKLRLDLGQNDPGIAFVLRCALCPGWSRKTTLGKRESHWQTHLRHRYGGE